MTETEALIALNAIPKVGSVTIQKLLKSCGSARAVLSAPVSNLKKVEGVGEKIALSIRGWESYFDLPGELVQIRQRELNIVTYIDDDYPKSLRQIYDFPIVLYVWGELKTVDNQAIAMVGSRNYTHYGQVSARKLAFQLASRGYTILSGLARGVDTFSHEGALAAGGRTVAVIGSGLSQVYPPENMELAQKIADGNGAIVSEYPLSTPPNKKNFPMRNRIVAGWSEGVLVVESPLWSGSLITANLAGEMGKTLYAVPGQIDSPSSAGCHALIRDGAMLVTAAEDIIADQEAFPLFRKAVVPSDKVIKEKRVTPVLNELEKKVLALLSLGSRSLDELFEEIDLSLPEVTVCLLQLEVKKCVEQLPGQRYKSII